MVSELKSQAESPCSSCCTLDVSSRLRQGFGLFPAQRLAGTPREQTVQALPQKSRHTATTPDGISGEHRAGFPESATVLETIRDEL